MKSAQRLQTFILGAALLCAQFVCAEANILDFPGVHAAHVGILITDLSTGRTIVEQNSEHAFVPASTMKLVTTATALTRLGADYRIATRAMLCGERDGFTWNGDLVIEAEGDPTLESENFKSTHGFCDSIVAAVKRAGIHAISGSVLVDSPITNVGAIPEWEINDVAYAYGAGYFGFNWRDNIYKIDPVTGETDPYIPGLIVHSGYSNGQALLRGVRGYDLFVDAEERSKNHDKVFSTMPNPAEVFVWELTQKLNEAGILVEDNDDTLYEIENVEKLYTHLSPTLDEIFRVLMVHSDNLFAEGMLRCIAPDATRSEVIEMERKIWTDRGLDLSWTRIWDGSGLARNNLVSPRFLTDVLTWMAKSGYRDTYSAYFPRAGQDGTLKSFLKGKKVSGTIAMKTGSMRSVLCYAGYRLDESGKPTHTIVVMCNNFVSPSRQARESIENLILKHFRP